MNATRPTEGLLETPERVDLEVNYASVGSRALAQVIDMAILGVGWLVVGLGLAALRPALGSWSLVLIFGVSFLLFWFYFAAFEYQSYSSYFDGLTEDLVRECTPDRSDATSTSERYLRFWAGAGYAM